MRVVYFLILLVVLVAVAVFAMQNNEDVTIRYFDRGVSATLPILIGSVYVLGMVSGWTVIGFLRRSLQRATERRNN